MSEAMITAIISFAGIIASGLISVIASSALVNWRLKTIESKLEQHNHYSDMFRSCSTDIAEMKKDISWILKELESKS